MLLFDGFIKNNIFCVWVFNIININECVRVFNKVFTVREKNIWSPDNCVRLPTDK